MWGLLFLFMVTLTVKAVPCKWIGGSSVQKHYVIAVAHFHIRE